MLHSPESTPLSEFIHLDERNQAHVLHELQKLSVAGDSASNIRLLFAEALQVVSALASTFSSSKKELLENDTAPQRTSRKGKSREHEETTSSYLNAVMLFNAAFEAAKDVEIPEESIDDYIFVRAVYTRLHRVQAAISLRVAEDVERDLRQFAKEKENDSNLRPAHFNAIMTRAFDAVPPPDDDYWAQLEHVPAAASAASSGAGTIP